MKILKRILAGITILVAIVLITALFVKKDYAVERQITINKPAAQVFDYIKYLKNQDYYSKWVMSDPGMKKEFSGTDASVGFIYAWNSNKDAGKGEQEITKVNEGKGIETQVRFKKPMEGLANSAITTEPVSATQTKVKWSFTSRMPYPFNVIRVFMSIENMLGKDIDTSLGNLKSILEKQ